MDDAVGRHLGQRGEQRLVAVARDIVVDLFGIDVAGVFKDHAGLKVEVLVEVALQLGDGCSAEAGDDGVSVGVADVAIESLVGIDADERAGGAGAHASGAANQHFFAGGVSGRNQGFAQLVSPLAGAGKVQADVDFVVVFCVFEGNAFGYLFQFFDGHSTAHLSSCASICSLVTSPETAPSDSTTGARLQAPTQRAVMRLMLPSLVV